MRVNCHYRGSTAGMLCLAATLLLARNASCQEADQDFAYFASLRSSHYSESAMAEFDGYETTPSVDIIYSRTRNRFRLFGELLITDEERELERFQVGWQLSDSAMLWLGRFHHSGSYWNTEFHHGQFLQTSISRPAIEEFEDSGGVLPLHVTGILFEQREEFDWGSAIQVSLSAGLSSKLAEDGLDPLNILNPHSGFEPAFNARIAFFPDALGETQIGAVLGKHNLAFDSESPPAMPWDPTANEIELETSGLYVDWNMDRWRVLGAIVKVSAQGVGGLDTSNHDFTTSYAQAEFTLSPSWHVYGRGEYTSGDKSYLNMFSPYVRQQSVVGVRWAVASKHAITFEGTNSLAREDHFHRFSVQWSAVFP